MTKKNIKIKRSKGRLYKKRKSSARRVIEVILMVLIVGGLGFLGYSAAGPLIEYIQNGSGDAGTTTPWEPPESSTPEESDSSGTSDSESSADTTQPVSDSSGSYLLPISALANQTALSQALEQAEKAGCTGVIVPMKDNEGHLLYRTNMSSVKDTELVTGTMPAGQILSAIKGKGFTSVTAIVPTLLDSTTPLYVEDMSYRFADSEAVTWLDASPERGGKRWVDPFREGTKQYYSQLVKELTGAGFDEVLLSELRYPNFIDYDKSILAAKFFTPNRYTALTALYRAVDSASGNKTAVSVNIADVLSGYGKSFSSTAEILADKSFTGTIYLTVNLSDFDTKLPTGENTSITLPADPVQKVKTLVSKAASYIGTNVTVVPVINPAGLSAEALAKCYEALRAS